MSSETEPCPKRSTEQLVDKVVQEIKSFIKELHDDNWSYSDGSDLKKAILELLRR